MSGQQYNYNMWEDDGWNSDENLYSPNEMMINADQLRFQQDDYNEDKTVNQQHYDANYAAKMAFFYEPPSNYSQNQNIPQDQSQFPRTKGPEYYEFDEPPLLEELEIFPEQILQKVKVVLDPFRNDVPMDCDLGGPLVFYLCLAFFMFLSGGKFNFGYVYGISVIGCLLMYFLLRAMTECDKIYVIGVASTLGYCILPVVILSALGVFFYLNNYFGYTLAMISVGWASFAASKIFCTLTKDFSQRPLIMYPCALLYGPRDSHIAEQALLVCTAHIHWDPEFCDVKLIQVMMLSHALKGVLDEASIRLRAAPVQLLLCGDFNSLPDSGVIEFLSSGRVLSDHQDFKDLPYKSVLQKISGCEKPNEFTHSFKLASAYSEDIMPYTNYTFHFKGIIDYIFYSKQSMTPLGLLGPLAADWLKDNKVIGCPHPHIPSDHFPLLVELEMMPSVQTNGIIPTTRR